MSTHGTVTGCSGSDFFFILVLTSDSSSRWIQHSLFNQRAIRIARVNFHEKWGILGGWSGICTGDNVYLVVIDSPSRRAVNDSGRR
jgi:hypothetical protein